MNDLTNPRHPAVDPDDIGYNTSNNPSFENVLQARMSRRGLLRGGFALAAASFFGGGVGGCLLGDDDDGVKLPQLTFNPVAKSIADALTVPAGYTATVLIATGDPINATTPTYSNVGTDDSSTFNFRCGDHHDGIHYFGLNAAGNGPDYSNVSRGVLCINHEVSEDLGFIHPNGPSRPTGANAADSNLANDVFARPTSEIDKEVAMHGVTVVEVVKSGNTFQVNRNSTLNRRITADTVMEITGPARGSDFMITQYSPTGTQTRGTINNCGNGYTPWGTYLTCEENWAGYFYRRESNDLRSAKEVAAFSRYGINHATSGRYNWSRSTTAGVDTTDTQGLYRRWDTGVRGATPRDDYRNVHNTFGWIVEIDPFNPQSTPKKRTAMGRFAHEACFYAPVKAGRPLVFYMGDDARNEYIYKFVSDANWDPADANNRNAGDKYLDRGKLYAAKFNSDGTGEWLLLSTGNPRVAAYTTYSFDNEADVLVNARLAADAAGATRMDRPEWLDVNPVTGGVYATLTNNSQRGSATNRPLDAANPRYYRDQKGSATQTGNVNGHIIRWREANDDHTATTFQWDIYLFGAEATASADVNVSGLTAENDFSSPDGLWFSRSTPGLLWIQTDDGAYTDVTNCMMLAAIPGQVGDGGVVTINNIQVPSNNNQNQAVPTRAGQKASPTTLRRFLVGPRDCEITGVAETPDGKAIFVNVQHPGENTPVANVANGPYTSNWPGGGNSRPRSATVVITRNDGGKIGV